MKVYRISKEKLDKMRPSLMTRMAGVLAVIIGASAFISFQALGRETDLRVILLAILLLGGTATFGVFRASRKAQARLDEMQSTFELVLDAGYLTRRRKDVPDATIAYSNILQIKECGREGLSIKEDSALRSIGVPSAVENYEQLKADLVLLTGLEITKRNLALLWTYLSVVLVIGLFAVSFLVQNRLVAACASFVLAAASVAAVIVVRRNPNLPKSVRGNLVLSLLPAVFLLFRGIILLFH